MEEEIDCEGTDEIVCPYCGYEHGDSWEASNSGEDTCSSCGKSFFYERETTVKYSTTKNCERDGGHSWPTAPSFERAGKKYVICRNCNDSKEIENPK